MPGLSRTAVLVTSSQAIWFVVAMSMYNQRLLYAYPHHTHKPAAPAQRQLPVRAISASSSRIRSRIASRLPSSTVSDSDTSEPTEPTVDRAVLEPPVRAVRGERPVPLAAARERGAAPTPLREVPAPLLSERAVLCDLSVLRPLAEERPV